LGIKDLRSDQRVDFVGGIRGLDALKERVDSGEMALALALYPRLDGATDGDRGYREHHAAENHLVRTETALRSCNS